MRDSITSHPTKTYTYRYLDSCQLWTNSQKWIVRHHIDSKRACLPDVLESIRTSERIDESESADNDTTGSETLGSLSVLERLGGNDGCFVSDCPKRLF